MSKSKKYIAAGILLLGICTSLPAQAAKLATPKGEVPQTAPLQPAPGGVAPGVDRNINYTAPEAVVNRQNTEENTSQDASKESRGVSSSPPALAGPSVWRLVAILLVFAAGLAAYLFYSRKQK